MYALKLLRRAVYAALTTEPLTLDGAAIGVYDKSPAGDTYVLLTQPTQTPTTRSRACQGYDCTMLIDCTSGFKTQGIVSSDPADDLAALVFNRLNGVRLTIGPGWQTTNATVEQANGLDDFNNEQVDVHRYLRLRWSMVYTA